MNPQLFEKMALKVALIVSKRVPNRITDYGEDKERCLEHGHRPVVSAGDRDDTNRKSLLGIKLYIEDALKI